MKKNYIAADTRFQIDFGWLKSAHTYSFGRYYDPERIGFKTLRVFNDDFVEAGQGFAKHPHDNMEIISIPTKGSLKHMDSLDNESVIKAGEVQAMSAGSGLIHSEMNASKVEPVEFFQIWIETRKRDIKPHYSQKSIDQKELKNEFKTIVAPDWSDQDVVKVNQDAWLYLGHFNQAKQVDFTLQNKENGLFIFLIEGQISVDGQTMKTRDSLEVSDSEIIKIEVLKDSKILLIEVPS